MSDDLADRRRLREQRSASTGLTPVFAAHLMKADRSRLYRIDQIGALAWRCEVWFGGTIHRSIVADTRAHMVELHAQFAREQAGLLIDGWTSTAP